jgi:hypothetical protein
LLLDVLLDDELPVNSQGCFLFLCLISAFSTKFINAFWDKRWLLIQVEQERCSIMDAVQLAPEDRVRKFFYHLSKIKIPTFDEAVNNLEDILHSGTENVHLLSLGAAVYGKSPAAVLQPEEERMFQQPSSSFPHLEATLTTKFVFFFRCAWPSNPFTEIHSLRNKCQNMTPKLKISNIRSKKIK